MDIEPPRVRRPVLYQEWNRLTFLHWRYPADVIQAFLPRGLTVDSLDGTAWVGVVPFVMERIRPPGGPALPWLSAFGEVNVRTYVRDPLGNRGVWFFSLDAARLPAMLAARATYGLPYFWSGIRVNATGDRFAYRCHRRPGLSRPRVSRPGLSRPGLTGPGTKGARCEAEVELGDPLPEAGSPGRGELADFLTARYRLYSVIAGRTAWAAAEHPPWPLRQARVLRLDQDLLQTAGLAAPGEAPLAHASAGVAVRLSRWHYLPRTAQRGLPDNQARASMTVRTWASVGCRPKPASAQVRPACSHGPRTASGSMSVIRSNSPSGRACRMSAAISARASGPGTSIGKYPSQRRARRSGGLFGHRPAIQTGGRGR